ncbi:hypothetical protein Rumeso_03797 [Rubellimicrobium mesophilum DSM 19309]|uniref:Uncharacterized protein n=1 Tax=Rubellimicrobium mesophilum DSM 19309 TaxID=442562 RepID=A0A017HJI3_9RHOB|nr:hypothetical protein [Rubellimicrobium mesophilum]EYD74501.1 hypothetical protein Rumeso_03797 [Rubellimicrobium mesophilum DSM 19309]
MRPHAPLALLAALALAACETPRESCLSSASRDLTIVESLIRQTQGNISRGYAIERDQEVTVDRDFCRVEREDGSIRLRPCDRTRVENVRRPVAIDLRAEQAKLDSLLERRAALASETAARQQACIATYPE